MFYKLSDKGKTKKDYKQNSRNEFQIIIHPLLSHRAAADDGFGGSQGTRV